MKTQLNRLIDQFEQAIEATERQALTRVIHQLYYRATESERAAVRVRMQPFLAEIEREMLATDQMAQHVNALLNAHRVLIS